MAAFRATAEKAMKEFQDAADHPRQAAVYPRPEIPQVSAEYQTSRRPSKRAREEEVHSQQPRKRLYVAEREPILTPAQYQRIFQQILPGQELRIFGDNGLLVSHGRNFPHIDKWVPVELNDWYEGQREVFVKWYYIFANFKRTQLAEADAWKWFLYCHPQKAEVRRLEDAAVRVNLKEIAYPSCKSVSPPMSNNRVDFAEIERELHVLAAVLRIRPDMKNEEFKALRRSFYKMYGQSSKL